MFPIARLFNISKRAVSRALITMDERIEQTLLEMARADQIEIESIKIKLEKTDDPTKLAEELFEKLRGMT